MMQTLAVNWNNLGMGLFIVWFLVVCVLLMLTVLIQKPQGGSLAGAFGSGAGSGQTAFGAKTGDALTWATIIMFVVWLVTAVGLNLAFQPTRLIDDAAISAPGTTGGATDTTTTAPATTQPGDAPQPLQPAPAPFTPAGEEPQGEVPPTAEPDPEPAPAAPEPAEQPVPEQPAPEGGR